MISKDLCKKAWEEMAECDPDCKCDDILTEYNEIITLMWELEDEIIVLTETLKELREQESEILDVCPAYSTMVEGVIEWGCFHDKSSRAMTKMIIAPNQW